jgi:hypothetical protein
MHQPTLAPAAAAAAVLPGSKLLGQLHLQMQDLTEPCLLLLLQFQLPPHLVLLTIPGPQLSWALTLQHLLLPA